MTACQGVTPGVDGCFGAGGARVHRRELPVPGGQRPLQRDRRADASAVPGPLHPAGRAGGPDRRGHGDHGHERSGPTGSADVVFLDEADAVNRLVPELQVRGHPGDRRAPARGRASDRPAAATSNGCDGARRPDRRHQRADRPGRRLHRERGTRTRPTTACCRCPAASRDWSPRPARYGQLVTDIRLTLDRGTGDVDRAATYAATNVPVTREAPDARRAGHRGLLGRRAREPGPAPREPALCPARLATDGGAADAQPAAGRDRDPRCDLARVCWRSRGTVGPVEPSDAARGSRTATLPAAGSAPRRGSPPLIRRPPATTTVPVVGSPDPRPGGRATRTGSVPRRVGGRHRHRFAARHRPGRGAAPRPRRAARPPAPARAARPRPGRRHDRPRCGPARRPAVDLTPAGWRLVAAAGHRPAPGPRVPRPRPRRAATEPRRATTGPLKVQVAGPWTLAAGARAHRGDRAVVDPGARRDLAQSLAEGVAAHVADVAARLPGAQRRRRSWTSRRCPPSCRADCPRSAASARCAAVEAQVVEQELADLVARGRPGPVVVHCCAPRVPLDLFRAAGARALSFDLALVQDLDAVGTAVEAGVAPVARASSRHRRRPPRVRGRRPSRVQALVAPSSASRPTTLPAAVTLTPACGLAGATPAYARAAMAHVREAGEVPAAGLSHDRVRTRGSLSDPADTVRREH